MFERELRYARMCVYTCMCVCMCVCVCAYVFIPLHRREWHDDFLFYFWRQLGAKHVSLQPPQHQLEFSKVSLLLYLLCTMNIEMTFENFGAEHVSLQPPQRELDILNSLFNIEFTMYDYYRETWAAQSNLK